MGRGVAFLVLLGGAALGKAALPADVRAFQRGAERCAHFAGEPAELGAHPTSAEKQREKFVDAQAKKYCDPLAAKEKSLRARYAKDEGVLCAIDVAMASIDDREVPARCSKE